MRPRLLMWVISATMGMTFWLEEEQPIPNTNDAPASIARLGAPAITSSANMVSANCARKSLRLSKRSPSGTRKTVPARKPAKDSVATQPVAAASAPNSAPMLVSMGVWKWIVPEQANIVTVSSAIRRGVRAGEGLAGLVLLPEGMVIWHGGCGALLVQRRCERRPLL